LKAKKVKEILDEHAKKERRKKNYAGRQKQIDEKIAHEVRKKERAREAKEGAEERKREEEEDDDPQRVVILGNKVKIEAENGLKDLKEGGEAEQVELVELVQFDPEGDDPDSFEGGMLEKMKIVTEEQKEQLRKELERERITMVEHGGAGCLCWKGQRGAVSFYQTKTIEDKGFNKWVQAQDRAFAVIKWVSLLISFKFYRMTYSFFMGSKQFLVLYQKKKFKKQTVMFTLLSQFLCELPIIISGVVSLGGLPFGEQLLFSQIDSMAICVVLIVLEFVEIATLDRIMKTVNVTGHKSRKSAAACESSDAYEVNISSAYEDEDEDDEAYPDWRLQLKQVEGNQDLFK